MAVQAWKMLSITGVLLSILAVDAGEPLQLDLRFQRETSEGTGRFHTLHRRESWDASETAVIVCDTWDYHHCLNAVRRLTQFAPRLNEVLKQARQKGAVIIHSPSDCMPAYTKHPARLRTLAVPKAKELPKDIEAWCSYIPSEERALYPIDQSDGGEDDDPEEHKKWAAKLKAMGRNPGTPWKTQSDLIEIDATKDYISDRGDEVWSILEQRGIKNVILTGVHTNMCVLGRPFGLRQMVRNNKNVVLMRDMTDTMYNPKRWPYVSHFTGTDLVIGHIERFVCPTVTSDQILGGSPFRFKGDTRPHLVMVMAEDEYKTNETLPAFAVSHLGHDFRLSLVFGNDEVRNDIPGASVIDDADVLLVSIRRRVLPEKQMKALRRFVAAGKPVIGIRTASHAFSLRNKKPPRGLHDWPEFDAQVFGGNYHNHHGNKLKSHVVKTTKSTGHPILVGLPDGPWPQGGSLYKTSPLAAEAVELVTGTIQGLPPEPVAWTFKRKDGGRSFYTSMGHVADFKNPHFLQMFTNGIRWASGLKTARIQTKEREHWGRTTLPGGPVPELTRKGERYWYRCVVRLPNHWSERLQVETSKDCEVWLNGELVKSGRVPDKWVNKDDANLLVVASRVALKKAPVLVQGDDRFQLKGRWQIRTGENAAWSNIPLPAKFGGSSDVYFEPPTD